jgi:hypothetical protein
MKFLNGYFNFLLVLITVTTLTIILFLFKSAGLEQQELLERAILSSNNAKPLFFHQELSINDHTLRAPPPQQVDVEPLPPKRNRLTTFIENVDCSLFKSDSNVKCLKKADKFYLPIESLQKKYDVKKKLYFLCF